MTVTWELDFYSRPILDDREKKLWEVLICESPTDVRTQPESLFRYSQQCSNTEVNSVWLRHAIQEAIAQADKPPDRVRFFRRQMTNMITKACDEVGISANASRRTLALYQWIEQRMNEVYPTFPNYKPSASPSVSMPVNTPQPLPDALIGQRWAFVTLEAAAFADMPEWDIGFGEAFPLDMIDVSPETRIAGLMMFSSRANAIAAWMSGLELAFLRFAPQEGSASARLVLETGASDAWILANLPASDLQAEAKQFEATKHAADGVHFIAIQSNPESESFSGFWLLQELNLG
ncbi:MAG TPA: Tab2/Atab2 family RNA-binding protein [Elainellaceae cyanobacterium]